MCIRDRAEKGSKRWQQAAFDADTRLDKNAGAWFEEAFGMKIGKKDTPALYELMLVYIREMCIRDRYNLARDYENGTGVPKDYKQAVYWYFKGAENGNAMAMERLYEAYHLNRLGLPRDDEKAHYWAEKARETRRKTGELAPESMSIIEKIERIWF